MRETSTPSAFASLEERSRSASGGDEWDRLSLRDHVVEVEIGAFQSERGATQAVQFDIVVELFPAASDAGDDVDQILSYDTLVDAVADQLAFERLNLLETLAERIAVAILKEPQAAKVYVRIQKLDRGPGALGVEIARSKGGASQSVQDAGSSRGAALLVLGQQAAMSGNLAGWIDQFEAAGLALVILALPEFAPAKGDTPVDVQRRIDLLSIEQAAWALAGHDARCVVMATRTELAHGAATGTITALAPAKLLLDAPGHDVPDPRDTSQLVQAIARELQPAATLAIGVNVDGADDVLEASCRKLPPKVLGKS